MKRIALICFLLSSFYFTIAQQKSLVAQGSAPDIYLSHTVLPKENYYSIGRLYNISPKIVAPFNKLDFEKALNPGQVIKIPLVASNFSQNGEAANGEVIVPVYHTVEPKEGLYRISVRYNKVPMDVLKQWNHLSSDVVSSGTKLIIGYLKVSEDLSPLAKIGRKPSASKATDVATKPVTTAESKPTPDIKEKDLVKTDTKETKSDPVVNEKTEPDNRVAEKLKTEPVKEKPVVPEKTDPQTEATAKPVSVNFNGGVFKKLFESQTEDKSLVKETGAAAVFKSTSGWQDGKYYCLHNIAKPETIIKVTNGANGKTIYAKVLDMIPDIKQNTGSLILISNAAAEELGGAENKLNVNLSYSK